VAIDGSFEDCEREATMLPAPCDAPDHIARVLAGQATGSTRPALKC